MQKRTANDIIADRRKMTDARLIRKDGRQCPIPLKIAYVFFIVCAAMGEWSPINQKLYGLPKVLTVGVIFIAAAYAIINPDIARLKNVWQPTLLYMSLIAALLLWSLAIWIMSFIDVSSMTRGVSKMIYQSISVMAAVSAVYLFGIEAIDLFTIGLCITNGLIMLLEIPNFGLWSSIQSLVTCLVTFGNAEGYARSLEIHDLTFVFGQLVLYYVVFAPKDTRRERKKRWRMILLCTFFFLVGMKRIAIPAVVLFVVYSFFLKNKKFLKPFLILQGLLWVAFFFLYIYGVRTGEVSKIMNMVGIDMMGRDYLWQLVGEHYDFSIGYMGHGFEYVDSIVANWYSSGLINHPYPFHNDILKVFVEMGFLGFVLWSGIQYVIGPTFWTKYADNNTALLYMADLGYMTITYLTDNTAFYFWSTMALRIIVLSYAEKRHQPPKKEIWKPKSRAEMQEQIRSMMQEG